jgi:hypothetical protein
MGVALNHMAEQEQIAFSCSLNGRELPLQGGEMFMQDAGTACGILYRVPVPNGIQNFSWFKWLNIIRVLILGCAAAVNYC